MSAAASHPSSDHGFCDGAQHQRQDRFRESPFDTAIFILQNEAAAETWPASDSIRMELLKAMAQGKPSAAGGEVYWRFDNFCGYCGPSCFCFAFVALLHVVRTDSCSAAARRLRDRRGGGDLDGGGGGW